MVSLAAGSGMDVMTRLYAQKLSEAFGKPVIVENKPGAATTLAANHVANAPPDGYTLVVLTSIALSINPTLFKQLNYDPQDFTPISLYVKSPFVLVIDPSLSAKTLSEFVELAKKANPPLNYASIGAGSVQHMSMEFAKKRLGFDATHVPYRSTPQSVTDLMGGHVAASFLEAGLSIPLIRKESFARSRSLRRNDCRCFRTCRRSPRHRAPRTTRVYPGTCCWCPQRRPSRSSTGSIRR